MTAYNLRSSTAPVFSILKESGTFQHLAAMLFNRLPIVIRNISDNVFCRSAERHLFAKYQSQKPRCCNGVQNLHLMDSQLFEEWAREQDRKFERKGRKVALIVDNCHAHLEVANLKAINLVFLLINTTCKTQPMDQGVITATKTYYRASVVCKYIDVVEKAKAAPNISLLDAMTILTGACHKVMPETIQNCFKKAGICSKAKCH